jgi:surfeit locus 1 family protein
VTRRLAAFVALAVLLGILFVRLGVWQLDRRNERRELNARIREELALPPVDATTLLADSQALNRRVRVSGTPDFPMEIVLSGRSRSGSPGVHILTPVRLPHADTAILVNRGWVYSPDAAAVDLERWRENRAEFSGFTQRLATTGPPSLAPGRPRTVRHLSRSSIAELLPYPIYDLYVVAQDSAVGDSTPARLDPPLLSDGPHLSYAIQWFAFAAIALGGAVAVVLRARKATQGGA